MQNKKALTLLLSLWFSFPNLSQAGKDCRVLFNPKEETNQIKALNNYFLYLSQMRKQFPPLSQDKNESLIIQFKETEDIEIRNKIISHNMDLVKKIAQKYQWAVSPVIDSMDLIQSGSEGLIKAISAYNPMRNYRFRSFSAIYIRKYIKDFVFAQNQKDNPLQDSLPVNQPVVKQELSKRLTEEQANPEGKQSFENIYQTASLSLEDMLMLDLLVENAIKNLTESLYVLPERSVDIFIKYSLNSMSQSTIGEMFNISGERVRQMAERVKNRMLRRINKQELKDNRILQLLLNNDFKRSEIKKILDLIDSYMMSAFEKSFLEYILEQIEIKKIESLFPGNQVKKPIQKVESLSLEEINSYAQKTASLSPEDQVELRVQIEKTIKYLTKSLAHDITIRSQDIFIYSLNPSVSLAQIGEMFDFSNIRVSQIVKRVKSKMLKSINKQELQDNWILQLLLNNDFKRHEITEALELIDSYMMSVFRKPFYEIILQKIERKRVASLSLEEKVKRHAQKTVSLAPEDKIDLRAQIEKTIKYLTEKSLSYNMTPRSVKIFIHSLNPSVSLAQIGGMFDFSNIRVSQIVKQVKNEILKSINQQELQNNEILQLLLNNDVKRNEIKEILELIDSYIMSVFGKPFYKIILQKIERKRVESLFLEEFKRRMQSIQIEGAVKYLTKSLSHDIASRSVKIFIHSLNPSVSLAQIGKMFDVSKESVSQIIKQVKNKMLKSIEQKSQNNRILQNNGILQLLFNPNTQQAELKETLDLINSYSIFIFGKPFHEYILQKIEIKSYIRDMEDQVKRFVQKTESLSPEELKWRVQIEDAVKYLTKSLSHGIAINLAQIFIHSLNPSMSLSAIGRMFNTISTERVRQMAEQVKNKMLRSINKQELQDNRILQLLLNDDIKRSEIKKALKSIDSYMMFAFGQPFHAYILKQIEIERAKREKEG